MAQPVEQSIVDLEALDDEAQLAAAAPVRHGFLPIVTNWFDRLFIAIYIGVAMELLWMRFLEHAIPLWVCHILVLAVAVITIRKG